MPEYSVVYIGLGSNLELPREQVMRALAALAEIPATRLIRRSSLFRSSPMGPQDQPDYINAVAALETGLEPEPLLDVLQSIEIVQGRVRGQPWGPRTLDLDILLFGDRLSASERLTLPHPGVAVRNFVLYPLAEIAPELEVPGLGSVSDLLLHCSRNGLERLTEQDLATDAGC